MPVDVFAAPVADASGLDSVSDPASRGTSQDRTRLELDLDLLARRNQFLADGDDLCGIRQATYPDAIGGIFKHGDIHETNPVVRIEDAHANVPDIIEREDRGGHAMGQKLLDRQANLSGYAVTQFPIIVRDSHFDPEGSGNRVARARYEGDFAGHPLPGQKGAEATRAGAYAAHVALSDLANEHHGVRVDDGHASAAGLEQIADLHGAGLDDAGERSAYLGPLQIKLALRQICTRRCQARLRPGDGGFALQASFAQALGAVEFDPRLIDGLASFLQPCAARVDRDSAEQIPGSDSVALVDRQLHNASGGLGANGDTAIGLCAPAHYHIFGLYLCSEDARSNANGCILSFCKHCLARSGQGRGDASVFRPTELARKKPYEKRRSYGEGCKVR